MKLLNIDSNAKTIKGQAYGYRTAVLYLAPWRAAGVNLCPMAETAGCNVSCLNTAGRGGIAAKSARFAPYGVELPDNAIQRARIARTRMFADNRADFSRALVKEIAAFVNSTARLGLNLTPCVRLNGTSDIPWETYGLPLDVCNGGKPQTIFDRFPDVQFYDYTKLVTRVPDAPNYHLTLSFSGANAKYAEKCLAVHRDTGRPLAVVVRNKAAKTAWLEWFRNARDGDLSDLRFLDPPGSIVVLTAKGLARRDTSGFVLDYHPPKGAFTDAARGF